MDTELCNVSTDTILFQCPNIINSMTTFTPTRAMSIMELFTSFSEIYFQSSNSKGLQTHSRKTRIGGVQGKSYSKEKRNQKFMATDGGDAHNVSPDNSNCTARRWCGRQNWLPCTLQHADEESFRVVLPMRDGDSECRFLYSTTCIYTGHHNAATRACTAPWIHTER